MNRKKLTGLWALAAILGFSIGVIAGPGYPVIVANWLGDGARANTSQFQIRIPSSGASAIFVPGVTNTNALGSTSLRFSNVFTTLMNTSGATTHSGSVTLGSAAPLIFTSPSVQSVAVNTTTISPASSYVKIGSTGTITLTGTPTITTTTATDGQYLVVDSTAAAITLQDGATLTNSGLCLSAATVAVTTSTPVSFIFSGTSSCWKQIK